MPSDQELCNVSAYADLVIPQEQIALCEALEEPVNSLETGAAIVDRCLNGYQPWAGSAFVPLAPTTQLRFDPAMSEVPKPHSRIGAHSPYSLETSRSAMFG